MTKKNLLSVVFLSAATSIASVWGYAEYRQQDVSTIHRSDNQNASAQFAKFESGESGPLVDFEKAAMKAAPAVVHIKTLSKASQISGRQNPFEEFFGEGFGNQGRSQAPQQRRGSGSGVSISSDGYIVTNNHVIDGAEELLVTLNNKKDYKAKVIGRDPSTDLAVIKIEAKDLPYLVFANSDDVHLGQWVLAVGYPLNLETTVTSGIVSAKSRTLGINGRNSKTPVEAFIQTDAAVNPGNSGGALVNTDGDIIGINSAIASPTGSYAGYSYAIPSNMVKKIASDLIEYGTAKRAYLGVMLANDQLSEQERKNNNIKEGEGVYILDVSEGSAAAAAGVQKGDFITGINGAKVSTGTQIIEKIAALRPGDKVRISYQRDGKEISRESMLKGDAGTYEIAREQVIEQLGASFENLDQEMAAQLKLQSGVVVKELGEGILTSQTRIKEGFIITKVNETRVRTVDELKTALKETGNSAIISGVYPSHPNTEYRYALNDLNR